MIPRSCPSGPFSACVRASFSAKVRSRCSDHLPWHFRKSVSQIMSRWDSKDQEVSRLLFGQVPHSHPHPGCRAGWCIWLHGKVLVGGLGGLIIAPSEAPQPSVSPLGTSRTFPWSLRALTPHSWAPSPWKLAQLPLTFKEPWLCGPGHLQSP